MGINQEISETPSSLTIQQTNDSVVTGLCPLSF